MSNPIIIEVKFNAESLTPEALQEIKDDIIGYIHSMANEAWFYHLNNHEFAKHQNAHNEQFSINFVETTIFPEMPLTEFKELVEFLQEVVEERKLEIADPNNPEDEPFDNYLIWDLMTNDPNGHLRKIARALENTFYKDETYE